MSQAIGPTEPQHVLDRLGADVLGLHVLAARAGQLLEEEGIPLRLLDDNFDQGRVDFQVREASTSSLDPSREPPVLGHRAAGNGCRSGFNTPRFMPRSRRGRVRSERPVPRGRGNESSRSQASS